MARAAVFLDRDGTIIEDRNYLGDPAGVELIAGAAAAIARLNRAGLPVVIVTNQSGIGRGYYSEADYRAVQERLETLLLREHARIDAAYHCPHLPEPACDCRKPLPGLFHRAALDHGLDTARSHYVGDRLRDILPGLRLGGQGYLIGGRSPSEDGPIPPEVEVVPRLSAAVDRVLARLW